jgi:hypothetical protein
MASSISDLVRTFEDRFRIGKAGGGSRSIELFNGSLGRLVWTPTANRDIIVPDAAGTVVLQNGGRIDGLQPSLTSGQPVLHEQVFLASRATIWVTAAVNQIAPTATAQSANSLRAFPWEVKRSSTISTIRSEVSTLLAATTYRIGLYSDNNVYPGTLLSGTDVALYDASTTGVKSGTLPANITISAGSLIWVAINTTGAFSARCIPTSAISNVLGVVGNLGTNSSYTGWSFAQTFGAMPNTFPAGASLLPNINAPLVALLLA